VGVVEITSGPDIARTRVTSHTRGLMDASHVSRLRVDEGELRQDSCGMLAMDLSAIADPRLQ
jgi:hypothetical protein